KSKCAVVWERMGHNQRVHKLLRRVHRSLPPSVALLQSCCFSLCGGIVASFLTLLCVVDDAWPAFDAFSLGKRLALGFFRHGRFPFMVVGHSFLIGIPPIELERKLVAPTIRHGSNRVILSDVDGVVGGDWVCVTARGGRLDLFWVVIHVA